MAGATAKLAELVETVISTRAEFQALDKEVHRLVEEMKRLQEKHERQTGERLIGLEVENRQLRDRLAKLEAAMDSGLKKALLDAIASTEVGKLSARSASGGDPVDGQKGN